MENTNLDRFRCGARGTAIIVLVDHHRFSHRGVWPGCLTIKSDTIQVSIHQDLAAL